MSISFYFYFNNILEKQLIIEELIGEDFNETVKTLFLSNIVLKNNISFYTLKRIYILQKNKKNSLFISKTLNISIRKVNKYKRLISRLEKYKVFD